MLKSSPSEDFHHIPEKINGEPPHSGGRISPLSGKGGSSRVKRTERAASFEEKARPFRLVKYFAFTSLIAIFIGTLALSFFNIHWAKRLQFKKSEDYARVLIENLNHQIYTQFQIPVYYIFGKIQLRDPKQFELMDRIVRNTLHSFNVEMVTLYDVKDNVISYSFDPNMVGKEDVGGKEYHLAISGKTTSKLVQTGAIWQKLLGLPEEVKVITFAPLREARPLSRISGQILGVVEVVQDLSDEYEAIFRYQIRVIITSAGIMLILLMTMIFVVKRGENIIDRRNLEQMRLRQELERAKHLSSLGEMVAGISHEIRNPLGIIRSSAELLKKKMRAFDPDNTIPDVIVEESGRLNTIITDFLNYARPRTPNLRSCRVESVLEKNISFLAPQIDERNITVRRDYAEQIPTVEADEEMLYQVFLNLIINAMEAMPAGGEISISIQNGGDHLEVVVRDKGEGIPDEILEKIWNPFFTTKESGTGLGLGIVKNIVEAHGGAIRIANRPIYGAEAIVRLPAPPEVG